MEAKAEIALSSITTIKAMLDHAIRALVSIYVDKDTHRLPPDIQHAIRILQSRQRYNDRLWLSKYGTGPEQERAQIELFINRDFGDLLELEGKKHGIGRLGCKACDYEYQGLTPVPLSRRCPHCSRGIQHAVQVPTGRSKVVEVPERVLTTGTGLTIKLEAPMPQTQQEYKQCWACDLPSCGYTEDRGTPTVPGESKA